MYRCTIFAVPYDVIFRIAEEGSWLTGVFGFSPVGRFFLIWEIFRFFYYPATLS